MLVYFKLDALPKSNENTLAPVSWIVPPDERAPKPVMKLPGPPIAPARTKSVPKSTEPGRAPKTVAVLDAAS